ncbi:MAG: glycosyl hydrolase [Armatimonadota bacterium]
MRAGRAKPALHPPRMGFRTALAVTACLLVCLADAGTPGGAPAPSPFGINGIKWFHARSSPNLWIQAEKDANTMKAAGIAWDRFDAWWGVIEPEKGRFDWAFMDRIAKFYRGHNLSAMPILCYSSAWSGQPPRDDEERSRFARYVYRTVRRYRSIFRAWEIWNEPNIPTFWQPQPSAEDYAELLKKAYKAAKAADPTCTVVGAATSMADLNYIQDLYRFGAWDSMDVLSIHPYPMGGNAHQQRLERILTFVNELNRATRRPKPIWITEIGWTADSNRDEVSQAISLVQAYSIALAAGVERVFWFCLTDWSEKWGILRQDGSPKKAYTALRLFTGALSDASFAGYLANQLGPEFRGLVFTSKGAPVIIAWNQGSTVRLRLPGRPRAVSILDESVSGRRGVLPVGPVPLIIKGVSRRVLRGLLSLPSPYPGHNLLWNPGFEETTGSPDPMPIAWSPGRFEGTAKRGRFHLRRDASERGFSAAISSAEDAAWDSWPVPVRPGDTVILKAEVRGLKATGTNAVAVYFWNAVGWGYLGSCQSEPLPEGDTDWTQLSVTAVVPPGAYMVRADLISKGNTGTVLFDNVRLTVL